MEEIPTCRFCAETLIHTVIDLGLSPLSNSYVSKENLGRSEMFFPLHVRICEKCYLAQINAFTTPDYIFSDYAYFSSYSESWLAHARTYVGEMLSSTFPKIDKDSLVVEVASNDGYLLQYFVENNIPVLGIEPASNVADEARKKNVRTEVAFFGVETARALSEKFGQAKLLLGNNVLAHVPDINDFIAGLKIMLHPEGLLTMEFPSLLNLLRYNQFDTIYHEHFSYLSLTTVKEMFAHHGLHVYDVRSLETHGGSLRVYATHCEAKNPETSFLLQTLNEERKAGLRDLNTYASFERSAIKIKADLLEFLIQVQREGKKIAAYGAAAKGNTLLNYAGIKPDLLPYVVDRNPYKQGRYLPGSRIPVYPPERIFSDRPDYILILPWNIKDEIVTQMAGVREWGAKFVVPIPEVAVVA